MSKIKFITDSASDITKEYSEKYNIDVQGFPITVGEKSFRDGDIPKEEYYDLIDSSPELPVHSQLTVFDFEELYEKRSQNSWGKLLEVTDILIDGKFILAKKDWNIRFRGSSNQRYIDCQASLKAGKAVEVEPE